MEKLVRRTIYIAVMATLLAVFAVTALNEGNGEPWATLLVGAAVMFPLSFFLSRRLTDPLYSDINSQRRELSDKIRELERKSTEISAVTSGMSEGLVLLNEKGFILSVNPAAARLFGIDRNAHIGMDILTVNRSMSVQQLIKSAAEGRSDMEQAEIDGRQYQLSITPVINGEGMVDGMALLCYDITDKAMSDRMRREFSANVSHELKTPLQSILGFAELLESGLVKSEDTHRFAGNIRSEATRLVELVNDIIMVSQLDEGTKLSREPVDLLSLASQVREDLEQTWTARAISVSVEGDACELNGVYSLLYELLYNLTENAIKYNRDGGTVDVRVLSDDSGVVLSVSDNGIGISAEHRPRVFERFYRVDKSHSKKTGGTGLGLSIVKHAAQYHGAMIELDSESDKGTTIRVRFIP